MKETYDPLKAIAYLKRKDKVLATYINTIGEFNLASTAKGSPFQILVRAIISQQLSTKAAATIHGRVMKLYTKRHPQPEQILDTDDKDLRAAGMSRAKVTSIKDLSEKVLDGTVPSRVKLNKMTDREIIDRLVLVKGIGQWSAEILLMFTLKRPNILPSADLGLRKGYQFGWQLPMLPSAKELLEYGELWRPYRSVASWYLWRIHDLIKNESAAK